MNILSFGLPCASCRTKFIEIFQGKKRFSTTTNEGRILPRKDHKGFYLENKFTGIEFATCCPNNVIISKYEWNGNGFTEVARKQIFF